MSEKRQQWTLEQMEAALELSDRRLARSETARLEAETLLEIRSRALSIANDGLKKREAELLSKLEKDSQKLLLAQEVAEVATFHVDTGGAIVGSRNLGKLLGIVTHVNNMDQIVAMIHPLETKESATYLTRENKSLKGASRDIRFLGQKGKPRWLRWHIRLNRGDNLGYQGAVRDITEERNIIRGQRASDLLRARQFRKLQRMSAELESRGTQLNERVEELEQMRVTLENSRDIAVRADRSKSRFLAMMSHDIRTPMNAILATLELLASTSLNEKQSRLLELSRLSGDQMLFLLADLIEVARSDGWDIDLANDKIDSNNFFADLKDSWRQLADKKGLELSVEIDGALPSYFVSDKTRFRQLLDNLLSNAIKYTASGSIKLSAQIGGKSSRQTLRVAIADTGRGIAKKHMKNLFRDGERVLNPLESAEEGTGLGLAICQRIVTAMDGEIGLESKLSEGSLFWFEVPLVSASALSEQKVPEGLSLGTITLPSGKTPRILMAEDVEANRIVLCGMLEHLGCEYHEVDDGLAVLEQSPFDDFDAILMDVSMPHMDGIETTRCIRSLQSEARNIPIIGVTAFASDDERMVILDAGMDSIVTKPIRGHDLREKLELAFTNKTEMSSAKSPESLAGGQSYLASEVAQAQFANVPPQTRQKLIEAVVADLTNWTGKFVSALDEKNEEEMARAHHALKGICAGFGAQALWVRLETDRHSFENGEPVDQGQLQTTLLYTIAEIEGFQEAQDHRQSQAG